jgi:hypothetical protein
MSLAPRIAPGPLLVCRGYRRGAGALWCRACGACQAPFLARVRWYVPADSIEEALGIRKESVTALAGTPDNTMDDVLSGVPWTTKIVSG